MAESTRHKPSVSIVIPVFNQAATLRICIDSIRSSLHADFEILVVDDGSTDGSSQIAASLACRVVPLEVRSGSAAARNRGVMEARADIVVFVDADVSVQPNTIEQLIAPLADDDIAAVFGSYDANPPAPGLISRFRNLLHHYTHQTSLEEAATFWAGCGAVRKSALNAVGGFDSDYRRPSVEDIEFGMRLRKAGYRILLAKHVQVTHWKQWTLRAMCVCDLWHRGVPWTHLLFREGRIPNDLNLKHTQRLSIVLAFLFATSCVLVGWSQPWVLVVLTLVLLLFMLVSRRLPDSRTLPVATLPLVFGVSGVLAAGSAPLGVAAAGLSGAGVLLANAPFYRFLYRSQGAAFAAAAFPIHLLFFTICGVAFLIASMQRSQHLLLAGVFGSCHGQANERRAAAHMAEQCGIRLLGLFSAKRFKAAAVFGFVLALVYGYQWSNGAYQAEFFMHDAPAHFVTGVMVADYMREGLGSNPIAFAEEYYLRSPKVAFGHWPPMFHILQGGWYVLFGATKVSAMMLMGAITACTASILFHRLKRLYEPWIAAATTGLFLVQPLVRKHATVVMSDMLTVLFCTLTVFALVDFTTTRKSWALVRTSLWFMLAVLTKENSLHLVIVVFAVMWSVGGAAAFRDWRRWANIGVVSVVGIGYGVYKLSNGAGLHGYRSAIDLVQRATRFDDSLRVVEVFFQVAPWTVFLLASWGVLVFLLRSMPWTKSAYLLDGSEPVFGQSAVWNKFRNASSAAHLKVSLIWLVSILLFFLAVPAPATVRYFMPLLVPLLVFFAHSVHALTAMFARLHTPVQARLVPTCVFLAAIGMSLPTVPANTRGFADAVRAVPVRPNVVVLICSDTRGEGAFVAERLMADREQTGIVLRGSKVLASSSWVGTDYHLLKGTAQEVYDYLQDFPVHYIVVDRRLAESKAATPDQVMLCRVIEQHPESFIPLRRLAWISGDTQYDGALVVYKNVDAEKRLPEGIRIHLEHTLGRTLELRLGSEDRHFSKTQPAARRQG